MVPGREADPLRRRDALRALLAAHRPADPTEAGYREQMLALCDVAGDPFSRDHYDPGHFTASAFVLSPSRDMLLLIFHGKLHRWLQPGGHIEPGDADVLAAARREVSEEVGIHDLVGGRLLDVDVHGIPALRGAPSHAHFDVRFLFQTSDLAHIAGSDAEDSRWFSLADIDEVASDASVMRAVAKLSG